MVLKRHSMQGIKEASVSFCNPTTGEMIHSDGTIQKFKRDKKTGKTKLAIILDACTSNRLFLVCKLTDTNREYFDTDKYSSWVGSGIFNKRSFTFKLGERSIELRGMSESFFPTCLDVHIAQKAYAQLNEICKAYTDIPLLSSPSTTGLILLESMLPRDLELETLEEKYEQLIRDNTTQPRQEVYNIDLSDVIDAFYYLDGRWMYAACLEREMPCGTPIHDTVPIYQKYIPGWYLVHFTIPDEWEHVGIIPVKKDKKWFWPNKSGEKYTSWVAEPELRIAYEYGWNITIVERLLFPIHRPFRVWRKNLVDMREEASTIEDEQVRVQVMGGCREIMLAGIGRLYSDTFKREQKVTVKEYLEMYNDLSVMSRLNVVRSGDYMIIPITDKLTDKEKKYQLPHLASYVWSNCRMKLTYQLLQLPYEDLLGCRLDAIYLSEKPDVEDTGKIGAFRLKGEIHETMERPKILDELSFLAHKSEDKKPTA